MSRTVVYSALVLKNRASQESNSDVTLLTAEEGLIRATVFGGPKSKLRAYAAPYNFGQVWIYRDPAKDYAKLSDFDVHSWYPGLREHYDRTMVAGGVADTILSTLGGGSDWDTALKLAVSTLDALENASEELCPRLLIHFLWRWTDFLGIQPQLGACSACGDAALDNLLWFSARENSLLCWSCLSEEGSVPENLALSPGIKLCLQDLSSVPGNQALSPKIKLCPQLPGQIHLNSGCRRWLTTVGQLDASLIHRYSMDNSSFNGARALTTAIMASAIGKRLKSWDW